MKRTTENALNEWQAAVIKVNTKPDGVLISQFAQLAGIPDYDKARVEMQRLIKAGLARKSGTYRGKDYYTLVSK